MLTDPNAFLVSLMNFDRDTITEDMINKLQHYVDDPQFEPTKISKVIPISGFDYICWMFLLNRYRKPARPFACGFTLCTSIIS